MNSSRGSQNFSMARKKIVKSPYSNKRKSFNDPKFMYKCFVRLENCNFSENSVSFKGKDQPHNSTDNQKSVFLKESQILNDLFIDENQLTKEKVCESSLVKQEKNNTKKLQEQKKGEVKFRFTSEKDNRDDSPYFVGKLLRARKKINYEERKSIATPDISKNQSLVERRKVPIYRKEVINSPKSRKRKGDLYDFIPDSEEDKDSDVSFKVTVPTKKKKIKHRVHFHRQSPQTKLNHTKTNEGNVSKYHQKINKMMNKFTEKLRSKGDSFEALKKNGNSKTGTTKKDGIESNTKRISDSVFNSTMLPESQKIILLDESIIAKSLTDHISEINITSNRQNIKSDKNISIPSSEYSNLNDGHSDSLPFESHENMIPRSFSNNNVDNLFGFADDLQEKKDGAKPINQIKVIQDVVINEPSFSNHYMSTPNRFQDKEAWRFDTNIVNRNPHFLAVKKNSLPALNQDPVLDHTFDERIDVVNKMVLVPTNKTSTRQQSILNYIEGTKECFDSHNHSQSLYDINELSPLKCKEVDKENSSERKKMSSVNQRPKRNILGILNENQNPAKYNEELVGNKADAYVKKAKTSDEIENFGFDSISEVIEDEHIDEKKAKPFRIEFTYKKCVKKYNKLPEMASKPVRDSEVRRLIEEDPGFKAVVDKDGLDCGELGLFEDIEQSPKPSKCYKLSRKKIADQDNDKAKAPKITLTKEARQWIKQFNEMCDEVENEELTIE